MEEAGAGGRHQNKSNINDRGNINILNRINDDENSRSYQ